MRQLFNFYRFSFCFLEEENCVVMIDASIILRWRTRTLRVTCFLSFVTCVLCPWFLLVFLQVYQSQSSFWVEMKTLQIAILAIFILFQAKVKSQETLETLSKKTGEWYYRGWVPCANLDWNETTTMNKGKLIEFSVWDFGLSRLSWVPLDVLHWVWGAKMRNHQTRA